MEGPRLEASVLRYDTWVDEALRVVIRRALEQVARDGLPGEHHFFITFLTDAEGVVLPTRLRARHPQEMTIVLQHQFWDLSVGDEAFEVTLSFDHVNTPLRVPFRAITGFADPAVNFGVKLGVATAAAAPAAAEPDTRLPVPAPEAGGGAPAAKDKDAPPPGGEVVTLDAFRRKP